MTDKTTTTTAAVGDAPQFPVAVPSGELAGSIFLAAATVVGGILWFRRKVSRDSTELIKDSSEGKLVKILMDERDTKAAEAKEAWALYNEMVKEHGLLKARNEYLDREVTRLTNELGAVNAKLDEVRQDLYKLRRSVPETGPAPL